MICKYFLVYTYKMVTKILICCKFKFVFLMWQWYHKNFDWQEELCWLFFLTTVNKTNIEFCSTCFGSTTQLQKTLWRHMKFWLQQWLSSSNKLQTSTPATNSSRWQNFSVTVNMIYSFCTADGAVVFIFELFDLLQNWGLFFKSVMRNWWVVPKKMIATWPVTPK